MGSSATPFVPPLFARFDRLRHRVPYMVLGTFPTPVGTLDGLRAETGEKIIFVKKDDLSGPLYGGNKVRKLEFLLADARSCGAVRVITCGAAGSNHALATALYAQGGPR